jgi:hypothetical protein
MKAISIFVLGFGLTVPVLAASGEKLEVTVSRVTRVAGQAGGNYYFFRVGAAPDDANRAMVCTLHWDPSTNERSAELLTSSDAGETWKLRVEDQSSREVSEDACAFGERGQAYFIAQPWNVREPHAYRSNLDMSDMHFYRSTTHGETWPAHLTSTFIDYARIIVDTQPGSPFRGRAYIAGHRTAVEMFPLIAVLEGGKQLVPAKQNKRLQDSPLGNWPCYPRSLVVLHNGDVLASGGRRRVHRSGAARRKCLRFLLSQERWCVRSDDREFTGWGPNLAESSHSSRKRHGAFEPQDPVGA